MSALLISAINMVKSGYSYGDHLDSAIRNLAPRTISTTQENLVMLQMLQAGRVDYLLIAPEEAEFAISEAGLNRQDFLLHSLQNMPLGEQRFLIFSQQVAPEVIEHINQRLRFYHQRVSAL